MLKADYEEIRKGQVGDFNGRQERKETAEIKPKKDCPNCVSPTTKSMRTAVIAALLVALVII